MTNAAAAVMALALLASCATDGGRAVDIVSREAWGWTDSGQPLPEHTITRITIHHGGVAFAEDRDPVEYLRSLQAWSRSEKNWIDVPYHYVIDLEGRVYEGRPIQYPGDTNTSYDTTGHALIVVVGNYDERELDTAQFDALSRLAAYLATEHKVALEDIRSHRDYAPAETTCPGANIYRFFANGALIRAVRGELSGT